MHRKFWSLTIAIVALAGHGVAGAATYSYSGVIPSIANSDAFDGCTATCDSFASLSNFTTITGTITIDDAAVAGGSFSDADITSFSFAIVNPSVPASGPGNPVTDNPLLLISGTGVVASNGSFGTTAAANLVSGSLAFEFLVPPFSSNGAFMLIDIASGDGAICLFYSLLGCPAGPGLPPAGTQSLSFLADPGFPTGSLIDTDADGVDDTVDNCILIANPNQRDTNGDGFGNVCDPDLDNNGVVNFVDVGSWALFFLGSDADSDFNGDGWVNFLDYALFPQFFLQPPGPSGIAP